MAPIWPAFACHFRLWKGLSYPDRYKRDTTRLQAQPRMAPRLQSPLCLAHNRQPSTC